MSDQLNIVLTHGRGPVDQSLLAALRDSPADIKICTIAAAYNQCRAAPPHAIIHLVGKNDTDAQFDPALRRLSRDIKGTLIYVAAHDVTARLRLLADGHVEAVLPLPLSKDHLLGVVRRALAIRRHQGSRATPRYPVRFKCMIKVVGASGLVEGQVHQIGRGGFTAMLAKPTLDGPAGDEIRFSIVRQGGVNPTTTRIEGDGHICWGTSGVDAQGRVRYGVRFTKLNDLAEVELLSCINRLRTADDLTG